MCVSFSCVCECVCVSVHACVRTCVHACVCVLGLSVTIFTNCNKNKKLATNKSTWQKSGQLFSLFFDENSTLDHSIMLRYVR